MPDRRFSPANPSREIEIFSGRSKLVAGDTFAMEFTPGKGTQFFIAGVPQGYVFLKVIGTATSGWNLPYGFPFATALRMTLFVVGAAALAGFLPGRRAAAMDVKEALAYE